MPRGGHGHHSHGGGGGRAHHGHGHGHGHGPWLHGGPGFGPGLRVPLGGFGGQVIRTRPGPHHHHHHGGPGLFGALVGGAAIGAVTASMFRGPPRGHVMVVRSGAPVMVPIAQVPCVIKSARVHAYVQEDDGVVRFLCDVTTFDGVQFTVLRRYSQFEKLRDDLPPWRSHASFPAKHRMSRLLRRGLSRDELDERRVQLAAWTAELVAVANAQTHIAFREHLYWFFDLATHYPPPSSTVEQTVPPPPAIATAVSASAPPPSVPTAYAVPATTEAYTTGNTVVFRSAPEARSGDCEWVVAPFLDEYASIFNAYGPQNGKLSASSAREALTGTKASSSQLRSIWELSDLDRDGALDLDEFATAMFLARNAARDGVVPMQLPPNVVPPSKRRGTLNPF